MIIIRDRENFLRWPVEADTIVLSGCGDASLPLTVDSSCDEYYLYSVTVDCDLVAGFYDYQLTLAGDVVLSGQISVR